MTMPRRSFAFRKIQRLTHESEFQRVRQSGRSFHGNLLTLAVLNVDQPDASRTGIITSRKIGPAVVRNRARRRLREIVRRHQHEVAGSKWIVIIARGSGASATYQQLEDEWLRLAKRASILTA
jgi:ribonuclease P protein component